MSQSVVTRLVADLCDVFADDPSLQHALVEAETVDDVLAALSYSADAAFELDRAAGDAVPEIGVTAAANARAAAAARQKAVRLILMSGLHEPAATPARQRPELRVVSAR